ncbi:MAG: type II secretion system inner membrane protein GspF [Pseudomonadota bacterium]
MAAFSYVALDAKGKQKKGVLEADSVRQIRQMLRDQGLVPLNVANASGRERAAANGSDSNGGAKSSLFSMGRRLSALDRVLFTRQLATLITAGLPIEEALQAIAKQSEKQHVRALVLGIRGRVLEGHALAHSLGDYPSTFNDMYRSTVAAGEQSGFLDRVLENLAAYGEKQFESGRDVEMALVYPVILFLLALAIVGALMVYVVPDMVGVIENSGQQLPRITEILIGISDFLRAYWYLLLAGIAAMVVAVQLMLKQPHVRLAWDRQRLSLPLVGRIARGANSSRYANTLSILTSSGVPLVEAMRIAEQVVNNQWLKRKLSEATQKVKEGTSLNVALEGVGYLPPMLMHMVASGEASGELDSMLARVASFQQAEVERLVTTVVSLFQPLMLVLMGGLVMFIVMAILLPILNMNQLV